MLMEPSLNVAELYGFQLVPSNCDVQQYRTGLPVLALVLARRGAKSRVLRFGQAQRLSAEAKGVSRAVHVLFESGGFRFFGEYDSRCWLGWRPALMVRPLSNDLRKRVVAAVSKGESCRAVASRFGVAVSSVVKWSQRYRSTGSVEPGKMGGHRKPVLDPHQAFIVKRLNQTPHLTLHAQKDGLAGRGVKVSHNAVWLFLRREGLRFKKNSTRS
jgi:transposase